ncbi:uncharacterized protein EURHEDRAFT_16712 [Aspergillus ruber CBS 135680]|uniref:Uncharacterized protein n=1 Tax=Aspergillus ruber (strain CBS 135680) TaxID=1388766 RepID=A0A017SRL5_ASPRC|nr:uncharacterized protein EURHEDRAFT_16712 [Aspergillus ruber CBS 135680]EYE99466.1 hypothetical protein EURHEDRAFT_16712 [Aspergillus ruber CBS 135680]
MITVSMNPVVSVDPQSKRERKKKSGNAKVAFHSDRCAFVRFCLYFNFHSPLLIFFLDFWFWIWILPGLYNFSLILHSLYISQSLLRISAQLTNLLAPAFLLFRPPWEDSFRCRL